SVDDHPGSSQRAPSSRHRPYELRLARSIGTAHDVIDHDLQRGVLGGDLKGLNIDHIAQIALKRSLQRELHRRRPLRTIGREHELHHPTSEVGSVDTLSGHGEEQLLDHLADMALVIDVRCAAARVELEWKTNLHPTTVRRRSRAAASP